MLKKITLLVAMVALSMGAMAQAKFGHMNSQLIITVMPEFTKAQADLDALQKQYQKEMEDTQTELTQKYQALLQEQDSLPKNILERRQKEVQEMSQRLDQFQQETYQALQKAQQDAMGPIMQKVNTAVEAVGKAEGVVYIFDIAQLPIAYIGAQSTDLTDKIKAQLGIK